MRPLLSLLLVTVLSVNANAQQRKILGRIVDADTGKPVKDVTVVCNGTTLTNHLGFFEVTVDTLQHKSLLISRIGYASSEIKIPKEERIKILLQKEYTELIALDLANFPNSNNLPRVNANLPTRSSPQSHAFYADGIERFYHDFGNVLARSVGKMDQVEVDVFFTINELGTVTDVHVSDTSSIIRQAIDSAFLELGSWKPATLNGTAVQQHFFLPLRKRTMKLYSMNDVLKEFTATFHKEVKYPLPARRMGIEGEVLVKFRINDSGEIVNVEKLSDVQGDCGNEVVRTLSQIPSRFCRAIVEEYGDSTFLLKVTFGLDKAYSGTSEEKIRKRYPDAIFLTTILVRAIGSQRQVITRQTYDPLFADMASALKAKITVHKLAITHKNLTSFPADIFKLTELRYLDFEGNKVSELPQNIGSLKFLEELYLVDNQLTSLPPSFGELGRLKILGLAVNEMSAIPAPVLQLDKLHALDLSRNNIGTLPAELANMKRLRILMLQNNDLKDIPSVLFEMSQLDKLYLKGNPLDERKVNELRKTLKNTQIFFEVDTR